MAGKLDDKVCIITGGSLGIGSGTAKECAREGGRVAILDIHVEGGESTVAAIKEAGGSATFIETDVSQAAEVEAAVKRVIGEYGKIDVLVNAAALQVLAPDLPEVTEEEWDTVMAINLKGPFLCCKYVIPEMLKKGGGAIVNVSSSVVLRGSAFSLPYAVSKAGMIQLTKTTNSQFCNKGIRVNSVIPGLVDTPGAQGVEGKAGIFDEVAAGIPVGRPGQPEDIAKLIVYLASDDAAYVSGAAMVIDGGRNSK